MEEKKADQHNDLARDFFQNRLALIISFILVAVLIGGCGYVLFSFKEEQALALTAYRDAERQLDGITTWDQMIATASTGWFTDKLNTAKLVLIVNTLEFGNGPTGLDADLAGYARNWCAASLETLSIEKGEIDGVAIRADSPVKTRQKALSQAYDSQMSIILDVNELVANWDSKTTAARTDKLNAIQDQLKGIVSLAAIVKAQTEQIVLAKDAEKKRLTQRVFETQERINLLNERKNWSVLGIIAGGLGLIGLIFGVKKYYF